MEFIKVKQAVQSHFNQMVSESTHLYRTGVTSALWRTYMGLSHTHRNHICHDCKSFIIKYGDLVTIKNNELVSIWDVVLTDDTELTDDCQPYSRSDYQRVFDSLSKLVKSRDIEEIAVFTSTELGKSTSGSFEHFSLTLPSEFAINMDKNHITANNIVDRYYSLVSLSKFIMNSITSDILSTVIRLIEDDIIYKGKDWKTEICYIAECKSEYDQLDKYHKSIYLWDHADTLGIMIDTLKSTSIIRLMLSLNSGMELHDAIRAYDRDEAPSNYIRSISIYPEDTKSNARRILDKSSYASSLSRRCFTDEDLKNYYGAIITNFSNQQLIDKFDTSITEISFTELLNMLHDNSQPMNILLESRLTPKLGSLTTSTYINSTNLFKWNNSVSWTPIKSLDTPIKSLVKSRNGQTQGALRFSLMWNHDKNNLDSAELESSCSITNESFCSTIKFSNKFDPVSQGIIDVTTSHNIKGVPSIENISWESKNSLVEGSYEFRVFNHYNRDYLGFQAEIEFDNQIYLFNYHDEIPEEGLLVATINYHNKTLSIKPSLESSSYNVWNLSTNNLYPVSMILKSPNRWDNTRRLSQDKVLLIIPECVDPSYSSGIAWDNLSDKISPSYKSMIDAVCEDYHIESNEGQLAGVGFSKNDYAYIVYDGSTYKVTF